MKALQVMFYLIYLKQEFPKENFSVLSNISCTYCCQICTKLHGCPQHPEEDPQRTSGCILVQTYTFLCCYKATHLAQ